VGVMGKGGEEGVEVLMLMLMLMLMAAGGCWRGDRFQKVTSLVSPCFDSRSRERVFGFQLKKDDEATSPGGLLDATEIEGCC
jgi:hypothetical protein